MYAICFDFPELDDEPLFAGWHQGAPGFAVELSTAMRFQTEAEAERSLVGMYGPVTRKYANVVEVNQPAP
jgi:hypothetical protein